ncbi:MAG: hypothetical protein J2P50_14170 [Hyphomicrobiaceae bacterium]|nr:hypothetical protein [Hyphomicrobiaceae bacterium]
MSFWDAATHMSKREWAGSCRRVVNRLKSLRTELDANATMKAELGTSKAEPSKPAHKAQHRAGRTPRAR